MTPGVRPSVAVVLAAGQGTRMRSARPKVLHRVLGRPLLGWVLETARASGCERIFCVVGHGAEQVREELSAPDVTWILQQEQLGTGHALAQTRSSLEALGQPSRVLVLSGDVPAVTPKSLVGLLAESEVGWGAMAVAKLENPGSLGRVIGDEQGNLQRIVEAADADPRELAIRAVNSGIYVLPAPEIFSELEALKPDNAKQELYLTDALTAAAARGATVRLMSFPDPSEALGVNERADLVRVGRVLSARRCSELLAAGVTVWEPEHVWIEPGVDVGRDTEIHAGVTLIGDTHIGERCVLNPGVWARNARIEDGSEIEPYTVVDGARVGPQARVGPFARLRPGTVVGAGSKIGNFVEIKNSHLADGVKAGHLSYLGDAEIGEGANIGAGTVTCNYDGKAKHPSAIGSRAFIGSDTMLVAPVRVGDDAVTAAGSVITEDVPDRALGVGRARQRNVLGWMKRRRGSKKDKD